MRATNRRNRSTGKCQPGPVTRNPYLNFCREFRRINTCQPAIEQIKEAAKAWHKLSPQEKAKYIVEAFYAKKIRRKRRSERKLRPRRKSVAQRRRRSLGRRKKR